MLDQDRIRGLFHRLNDALRDEGEIGEIGIVGGTVMCLVYNARKATRDVDAVFEPASVIRKLAKKIAEEEELGPDWLNDATKGYIHGDFRKDDVLVLSHLRVWAPQPEYMLAMKCISARWDTSDREDVEFLIRTLGLKEPKEVFKIIEGFYPKKRIPPKTQFLIEELLEA